MNVESNKFNYFLHKLADPAFNVHVQKGNLILTKAGQASPLEEKVKWIVSYISTHKTPLTDKQLRLVQEIKHNLSTAVSTIDQEIQNNIKPYLDQLGHINSPNSLKPFEVSLQVAPPPANQDEFASNLQLMLEHFPRYQLHNDLSVVDTSFQSLPTDWDFDLLHNNLLQEFKKYETAVDLSALKGKVLDLLKTPIPVQMGIIIETSHANVTNRALLREFVHMTANGVPCVVNRNFFQAQANNIKSLPDLKLDNFDVYTHKNGALCVVIPKGKSLEEFGFDPKELEISKGEHLNPSEHAMHVPEELSAILLNETDKQRFYRFIDCAGHGYYPGTPNELNSNSPGMIAGQTVDEFQKTLAALKDKNLAFLFIQSCYSGGTNISDIHLPDQTLPCPIFAASSFDVQSTAARFEGYDATRILNAAQKMLLPPRSRGSRFENLPRQLSKGNREKLSQVMDYDYATHKLNNMGSLLLPSNMRDIPKVAYALTNPEEILDVSRAHQKARGVLHDGAKPLEDQNTNRIGYLFSDPIVPFSIRVSGELPMILLSKGGSMHHVIKEISAPQQSLEDIAKETFNAFHDLEPMAKLEPANKVFFIGKLKCLYEGKEVILKRVMIKNTFKEREILFQVEGEQDFRKFKFKQGNSTAYPWRMDNKSTVIFSKGLQEIYQNAAASAPSSAALVNATAGKQSQVDFIEALDQTFFGEQMPEQGKLYSALIQDSFNSSEKGDALKRALTELKQKISNRQEILKIMGDAVELAGNLKLNNLKVMINQASYTALMDAAITGDVDKAKIILNNHPQTINEVNASDSTSLHIALSNKHYELAKWLIEQGSDLAHADKNGYSPMRVICENAEPEFMEWVINQQKVDLKRTQGAKLLIDCLKGKNRVLANFLVDRLAGADADKDKYTLLHSAVEHAANKEIIEKLLNYPGMNINRSWGLKRQTALMMAAAHQNVEVLKLLLEHHADPNLIDAHFDSSLNFAIVCGKEKKLELVKLLVEAGANVDLLNEDMQSALFLAVHMKDKPLIEYLISKKASKYITDTKNKIASLELASNIPGLLEYILQIPGIDINPYSGKLDQLFQKAIKEGNLKKAELLLARGAKINQSVDKKVPLLLHYLRNMPSAADPLPMVKFFLDHGGDLMQQDNEGNTVMHWAMEKQNLSICKYLKESRIPNDKPANRKNVPPFMLGFSETPNIAFLEELLRDKDLLRNDLASIVKNCLQKWGLKHPQAVNVLITGIMHEVNIEKLPESFFGMPKLHALLYLGKTPEEILTQIEQFPECVKEKYIQLPVQVANDLSILKALINKGAEIGPKPLFGLCDLELIKLLETRGIDLSGEIGIHYLKQFVSSKYTQADQREGILYLLSKIKESPHTALNHAILIGKPEFIDLVLDHPKMNFQAVDPTLGSPMYAAILNKDIGLLKKLISKNAVYEESKDAVDNLKNPLIDLITCTWEQGSDPIEIAKLLVESGYAHCINEKNKNNYTPLQLSLFLQQEKMAAFLIGHGADINLKDSQGNTHLHQVIKLCTQHKEEELIPLVKLLISNGAKWDVLNREGLSARDLAIKMRLGNVVQLMK